MYLSKKNTKEILYNFQSFKYCGIVYTHNYHLDMVCLELILKVRKKPILLRVNKILRIMTIKLKIIADNSIIKLVNCITNVIFTYQVKLYY